MNTFAGQFKIHSSGQKSLSWVIPLGREPLFGQLFFPREGRLLDFKLSFSKRRRTIVGHGLQPVPCRHNRVCNPLKAAPRRNYIIQSARERVHKSLLGNKLHYRGSRNTGSSPLSLLSNVISTRTQPRLIFAAFLNRSFSYFSYFIIFLIFSLRGIKRIDYWNRTTSDGLKEYFQKEFDRREIVVCEKFSAFLWEE